MTATSASGGPAAACIALVGDHDPRVMAQRAIPRARSSWPATARAQLRSRDLRKGLLRDHAPRRFDD